MGKSYLRRLYSKNLGLFKEIDIEFNDKFNYLVGPNGCGKSSVLKNIAYNFSLTSYFPLKFDHKSENWIEYYHYGGTYRIRKNFNLDENNEIFRRYRKINKDRPLWEKNVLPTDLKELVKNYINFCPLFIGAYRRIDHHKINDMHRESSPFQRRLYFWRKSFSNLEGINLPNAKEWMINRYSSLKTNRSKVQGENWYWLSKNFSKIAPKGSSFDFIKIRKDLEPLFSQDGNICYLEELSGGYQAFLSLIFYIFDWIENVNENDYDRLVENAKGTVIIDELDIHLHPDWQLTIRETLDTLFPNLQFIVSTNSPHMVATANPNELLIFEGISPKIKLKPSKRTYSGWTTDQILVDIMGVRNLESKKYNFLLKKAFDCVERNNTDYLKEIIIQFEDISHPSDTVVSQLKIKLASMLIREDL